MIKVVLDTTVWMEYLRQKEPIAQHVGALMLDKQIVAMDLVFSELIYCSSRIQDQSILKTFWLILPRIELTSDMIINAGIFANQSNYLCRGIGLIEAAIIKAVTDEGYLLWTLDERIRGVVDTSILYK
ncbi:MAG: PIN domain-containing protein [Bacteroidota bacterium]